MNLFIDNKSGAPIYEQLYTQIKNQILSGELQPEEAMPSIRKGQGRVGRNAGRRRKDSDRQLSLLY